MADTLASVVSITDSRPGGRRVDDHLSADERQVCRALRSAARSVGAACLPAEYRSLAFELAAERELARVPRA